MGILGTIMGRREPEVAYRTVDGGHPAPYPDMTDEQLYNYEMNFNVARRTFDKPPHSIRPKEEEATIRRDTRADMRTEPHMNPNARAKPIETAFDAPRYTARAPRDSDDSVREPAPVFTQVATPPAARALDLSKPVRLTTTKQPVEIITTRARHPVYKVHGYIGDDDVVTVFTIDGRLSENGFPYLENIPAKQQLHVNVYPNPDKLSRDRYLLTQHASRDEADADARPGRLACVPLQFDA